MTLPTSEPPAPNAPPVEDEIPATLSAVAKPPLPWSRLLLRGGLLLALLAVGFVLLRFTPLADFLDRERLATLLTQLRDAWWSPLLLLGLYTVLAPMGLPMTPLIFAGAAVFGTAKGAAWNVLGCYLGATASYLTGRALGRELVVQVVGDRLRGVEKLLQKHGFWALVRIRFLPVPFALVNYGAALSGIPLPTFLGSAALGLLPSILIFTHFFASLAGAAAEDRRGVVFDLVFALGALLALSLLPTAVQRVARWRRYRRLRADRQRPRADAA